MRRYIVPFLAKVLYLLPAAAYCGFFAYVGLRLGFDGFPALTLVYAVLLIAAACLLWKNRWWGCIPGMIVGGSIIYLFETSHAHHHINESHIGIAIVAYFVVAGLLCHQQGRQ